MANEIRVIDGTLPSPEFVFLYPVAPRITTFGGQVIVPSAVTDGQGTLIFDSRLEQFNLLSPGEITALDSGDAYIAIKEVILNTKEIEDIWLGLRRVRHSYDEVGKAIGAMRNRYNLVGRSFDADAPTFPMPDLVGLELVGARAALEADRLQIRRVRLVFDDTAPMNTVIRHRPAAGVQVVAGDPVDLQFSGGPDPNAP